MVSLPLLAFPLAAQQPAAAQAPAKPDHVAAIKQSLGASTAALHKYEWIETTAASMKGEEKSRKQEQCYYGVDGNVQFIIKDYLKAGDSLTVLANAATDRIGGVTVATFTDSAKNAVGLKVTFGAFPDGTVFPAQIDLDVKEAKLNVAIQNSGYKKRS